MAKAATITITNCWQDYFPRADEGLGTIYERFILHNYFDGLKRRYGIQSVLEAPSFGMTGVSGVNSMWWASKEAQVTIVDQSSVRLNSIEQAWSDTGLSAEFVYQPSDSSILPFADGSFDMAWNFAALWHVKDGEKYLNELARVARKALFLCVPNKQNVCWVLRPHNADDYELKNIEIDWITSCLAKSKWQLMDTGFFDVPPWPDIAMKKENILKVVGLNRPAKSKSNGKTEGLCILDYFNGRSPAMGEDIMKYGFLENSPNWLKRFWAHHRFLVFEKK